jgi:hypothetical protein
MKNITWVDKKMKMMVYRTTLFGKVFNKLSAEFQMRQKADRDLAIEDKNQDWKMKGKVATLSMMKLAYRSTSYIFYHQKKLIKKGLNRHLYGILSCNINVNTMKYMKTRKYACRKRE